MKNIALPGLMAFIATLFACGQTSGEGDVHIPENWNTLDGTDYSIQYPDSFELNQSGQMGESFILFSKHTSEEDPFRENINLLVQDLTGQNNDIDLDKYVELSEGQVQSMLTDGNIIESKRLTTDSKEYHKIIYTGKQDELDLKWLQYYWVGNNKAYVLTLTCEENQYDAYATVGEKIMNSFRLK